MIWSQAALDDLLERFLNRTLPIEAWTHHAHLLVATMLARRMSEAELLPFLRQAIAAYNVAAGGQNTDSAGYHEAITAFYAHAISAFAQKSARLPMTEVAERLLASPLADRKVVMRAYRPQTLKTVAARLQGAPFDAPFDAGVLADQALSGFTIRLARDTDAGTLKALMDVAIGELLKPFLPPQTVEASREVMGLDTQLIADETYYVVERDGLIVGCGGWSRRATLFGGDHSAGRDAALLDPAAEPARVRAMYTRPGFERRGIGRLVLDTCEAAARSEGFGEAELAATLGGEPLYLSRGYVEIEAFEAPTSSGLAIPLKRMRKRL
jgi:GNAT superfamily N-acetyltransferase